MPFSLDERLRPYATEKQWVQLSTWAQTGSIRKAAKQLDIDQALFSRVHKAVQKKAAIQGYSPQHDLTHPVPEGLTLSGASTLYKADGSLALQWVKTKTDDAVRHQLWQEIAAGLADDIPRVALVAGPKEANADLMACYPIGDHHLGMLAWSAETGEDYDLKIGEKILVDATDYLVKIAPPCDQALVMFCGDYLHYDSFVPETPASRNKLDADSRFPKMVQAGVRLMRYVIEAAARRHKNVRVMIVPGNHDPSTSIFLMACMKNIYENNPRISVDDSPMDFHYYQFGKNLIGGYHGHNVKLDKLPLIMATDRPKEWGETTHRVILTGHVHHNQTQKDVSGCSVESLQILATEDAWAHKNGYRSARSMVSIVFHREHGEWGRFKVNPGMLASVE